MITRILLILAFMFMPIVNTTAPDEFAIELANQPESLSWEDQIRVAALSEFDHIYHRIQLDVTIVTTKTLKRQIIIKRDGKFVGGKVIGYATAFNFLEAFDV